MRARGAFLLLVLGSCGDAPLLVGEIDASVDASLADVCVGLRDRYREIVIGLDDTCATASDCALVGGVSSCDCQLFLGPSCWGHPVNSGARDAVGGELSAITTEFRDRCRDVESIELPVFCDCEPWATPTCVMERCGLDVGEWCLGSEFPDAGP